MSTVNPRLWTRKEVADGILAGDALVIFEGHVLRITPKWLASHPGGALAILHFVGRDGTDEINAYHCLNTLKRVKGFVVGKVDVDEKSGWDPLVPPVEQGWVRQDGKWHREASSVKNDQAGDSDVFIGQDHLCSEILLVKRNDAESGPTLESLTPPPSTLSPAIQAEHARAYRKLHERVTAAGLYQTRYLAGYGPEVVRYLTLAGLSALAYRHGWFLPSAFCLGLLWHQLSFIAHDLGHMGVTHNWVYDRVLGILIADFIGGLSIGWGVDVSLKCI